MIPMGTIAMSVEHLQVLLRRVGAGEDPDMVLMEELVNSRQGSIPEYLEKFGRPIGGEYEQ